jgi:hypothetical protein
LITTRVKSDSTFFLAQIDRGIDGEEFRDAYPPLQSSKIYYGLLFEDSIAGQTQYVEYTTPIAKEFKGEELEEIQGDFRLIKY